MTRRLVCVSLILIVGLVGLVSCALSPLGRRQLILVPESQMNLLGVQAFEEIKSKTPRESDRRIESYIHCVAQDLLKALDSSHPSDWEIQVFKEPQTVNAFAIPGKKIGIYTGILRAAQNADQLAAVVGHEIGHVIARHGQERISQNMAIQAGMQITDILLKDKSTEKTLLLGALGLGAQFGVLLPYSRMQESESDIIGQELMAKAGFDPSAAIELWKNMATLNTGGGSSDFFSTHPSHEKRIQKLSEHLPKVLPLFEPSRRSRCTPSSQTRFPDRD